MLEKGQNFERQEQLTRVKFENHHLKADIRKNERELAKLKGEVDELKDQLDEARKNTYQSPQ